jgi:hypothetical protein
MINYHLEKRNYLEESKKKLRKQLEMSELFRDETIFCCCMSMLFMCCFAFML